MEQFDDALVHILLGAAVISYVVSFFESSDEHDIPAWIEPAVIILILVANAGVGIYQDYDAENALAALKQMSASHAEALRDGKMQNILASDIVPGDIIEIA
jgi:magnesium-transporting ATPase (P-type)